MSERVPKSNRGYQLLKKAGWIEGTGLGAQKQGRTTPLPVKQKTGRSGIGCAPSKPPEKKAEVPKPKKRRKTKTEKKLQRISRDGVQYRAIRRKLEEEMVPGGMDSNPLLRDNALTASNPLLP